MAYFSAGAVCVCAFVLSRLIHNCTIYKFQPSEPLLSKEIPLPKTETQALEPEKALHQSLYGDIPEKAPSLAHKELAGAIHAPS